MASQELGDFPKEMLCDRYEVQQQLAKKAGRRTLLARDIHNQELVVIKLLLFSNDFEWNDLKLFEREAETLKALSHPAIPRYLDFFEIDLPNYKGFALVQSYIEAKSLEEHLKVGRSFSEVEVKQLARAILEILMYLHGRQPPVIHRDIKPSNILLTDRSGNSVGQVYLVDFGSVQTLTARRGSTMTVVGTYGYMPPEQFGGRATPGSDLYSLGATLIYLVTGQHPADLPQADLRIGFEQAANISPSLSSWLKWMTKPILSQRLASAQYALQALDQPRNVTQTRGIYSGFRRPPGSQVVLTKNANLLQILIPPAGFFSGSTYFCLFLLIGCFILAILTQFSLQNDQVGLLMKLIGNLFILFNFGTSAFFLLQIFLNVFGKLLLCINHKQISLTCNLFGIERHSPLPSPRQNIIELEFTTAIYNKPYLIIWAGMKKYELSPTINFPLTGLEVVWLAHELSDWLGLPILRE